MRLIIKTVTGTLMLSAMSLTAFAQQLPNSDFEKEWVRKAPWTSTGNEKDEYTDFYDPDMTIYPILSPEGWTVSNVIGMEGLGATVTGKQCDGYNGKGVLLVNTPNPFMSTQIVPAYLTLGTSWSTSSVVYKESITPTNNDGGSFGGIEFTYRPDAIRFRYKLTRGKKSAAAEGEAEDPTIKPDEKPTVVAYLWKGTWTQKDVPGNITMASVGAPTVKDMVNRDRNILGLDTPQGGEVTKSDDAELIASINTDISFLGDVTEWKTFKKEFEYKSDARPSMMNIVIAAGDYFGGADVVGKDNSLMVDEVELLYYSRLKSLKIGETEVNLTDGVYDYYVGAYTPSSADVITFELLGKDAKSTTNLDTAAGTAIIKVENVGADSDGKESHIYTLHFAHEVEANEYQPENFTFEDVNVDCIPWTSANNPKISGTQPKGWTISHVIGMGGVGATQVGSFVDGCESPRAVRLTNTPNPYMATQIVPAYITLGTTWSTSKVTFAGGITPTDNDGGSFGGIEFTHRPDGLEFMYTRQRAKQDPDATTPDATIKPDEKSTVVAYLWKGHWTQENVPGEIKLLSNPSTVTMKDRDRCVLGMAMDGDGTQGGAVTPSNDAELIASLKMDLTEDKNEWTKFFAPLDYNSDATPAMANIIISAGDYFGGAEAVGKGNSITVDNVRFVYFSRLESLEVEGNPIALEDGKYDYQLDCGYPTAGIVYKALGKSSKVTVEEDKANNKIAITVSNVDGDIDGEKSHTYTLSFKAPAVPKDYPGYLNVKMRGNLIAKDNPATVTITPTGDNTCDFLLPNLVLSDLGDLGNIELKGVHMTVADGVTTYNGNVDGMKLLNGVITANVTLTGTTDEAGNIDMKIDVLWVDMNMPIEVTFSNNKSSAITDINADENAQAEFYTLQGIRVPEGNLIPGIYIKRQGNTCVKVIVK